MKHTAVFPLKIVLFLFLSFFFTNLSIGQAKTNKSDFWEHVRFGGGIGLSTGNNVFSATLAPSAI